jgi:hypothetical protein
MREINQDRAAARKLNPRSPTIAIIRKRHSKEIYVPGP